MRFIGLDVHKRVVQACVCDEHGATLHEERFDLTLATLRDFAQRQIDADSAVTLEATTNTWAIVDVLAPYGARIVVGNPMRTRAIAFAKVKTDRVDAHTLAQLLRCNYLPSVWIPDAATRDQRALASRRSALVRQSVGLKNRLHSVLHQRLIQPPAELFSQAGMAWLAQAPLPALVRGEIDTLLRLLDALHTEQDALRVLVQRAAFDSQAMQRLITLPGIDAVTAQALLAAIGSIERFEHPDQLAAYFGLVPSVHQSAEHAYHGRITKHGNSNARWLLIQAAHTAAKHPGPLGHQFEKLARRKPRHVAIVAIARKLAILVWHLLKHGTTYRYAVPTTVQTKLAHLRVAVQGKRKSGPARGQPRPKPAAGHATRLRKSLDHVLCDEGLPATTPAPPAEQRLLQEYGLREFAQHIQTARRVPRASAQSAQDANTGG